MDFLIMQDTNYIILIIFAFALSMWSQYKIRSTFTKYSKIKNIKGHTGVEVTKNILARKGLDYIAIERVSGNLTDHYDPKKEVIRLSEKIYDNASVAAIGVAAHETGHAIQKAEGYVPMKIRGLMVPAAKLGSSIGPYLAIFGLLFEIRILFELGILFFVVAVLFYIITLPVEFNASSRAIKVLDEYDILTEEEISMTKKVLRAAALTYVASALVAITSLARLILLSRRRK